jgi:hypothetical protein
MVIGPSAAKIGAGRCDRQGPKCAPDNLMRKVDINHGTREPDLPRCESWNRSAAMTDLSLIDQLKETVRSLEAAFDAELAERRRALRYRIEKRRAVFDRDVLALHRQMRISLRDFLAAARPMVILTAPVIYSLILPFALLDLFVTVYQAICFPV